MSRTKAPIVKAWLQFFVVSSILTNLPGFFVGVIGGAGGLKYGWINEDQIWWMANVSWYLLVVPVSFFTFRWTVTKFLLPGSTPLAAPPNNASVV